MLVTMTSNTSGKMVMLAEHLRYLFEILGKDCTARGIFTLEQLPPAIAKLKALVEEDRLAAHRYEQAREAEAEKIAASGAEDEAGEKDKEEDDEAPAEMPVWLGQRAAPLLRLMERTLQEKGFILWETSRDF